MVEEPIDPPAGWSSVSPTEIAGMRWHRYRYRPTETVSIEVQLGESLDSDGSDAFRVHLSMRLANKVPVTHGFQVASYDDLTNAKRATESLLRELAEQVFDSMDVHPVTLVQDVIGDLGSEEDTGPFGALVARVSRLLSRR